MCMHDLSRSHLLARLVISQSSVWLLLYIRTSSDHAYMRVEGSRPLADFVVREKYC